MAGKKQYDYKEMAELLEEEGGVVRRAAERLGCYPSTVYRYAEEYKTVREAMQTGRKNTYAKSEEKLIDALEKGERWAIERVQETFGEHVNDGLEWIEKSRKEITGPDGDEVTVKVVKGELMDEV